MTVRMNLSGTRMELADDTKWSGQGHPRVIVPDLKSEDPPVLGTRWMGVASRESAWDLMSLQDILWEKRPGLILECGTGTGATSLFLACLCELMHRGEVVTLDREKAPRPLHAGITYVVASPLDQNILCKLEGAISRYDSVMVILRDHVGRDELDRADEYLTREMDVYGQWVSPGHYLVVEDTGRRTRKRVVERWLESHPDFRPDTTRETEGQTWHAGGYLLRLDRQEKN